MNVYFRTGTMDATRERYDIMVIAHDIKQFAGTDAFHAYLRGAGLMEA